MLTAGLDIGSRTIALVEWNGERILRQEVVYTGTDPLLNSRRLIEGRSYDRLVATGYGRHLASEHIPVDEVITEIKAHAMGARYLYPDVRTLLDIGGQDSKAILIRPDGNVAQFEMNDRCAAGTGRFLENMATALELSVEQLGEHALAANGKAVRLSSMCTVFAESEVVSLIGRGENSQRIALGIHQAIVDRVYPMLSRVGIHPRFVFAGGVARNPAVRQLLSVAAGTPLTVPDNPQTVGALGAALYAAQRTK